jgi:TAT (twin-arginine translocation) pathway signal sequence
MRLPHISRRTFLTSTAAATAAIAAPAAFPAAAWAKDDDPGSLDKRRAEMETRKNQQRAVLTGQNSHNGWEMEKTADNRGNIYLRPVPGVPVTGIQVRIGAVETVLVHLVRRFHYEVDQLRAGEVVGWQAPESVRPTLPESNLASGTAVRIRPGHYPAGASGNFFPLQLVVLRDILAELDGVVRWGGDDHAVNEALFYLDVGPDDNRLTALVAKLRDWQEEPGKGAGSVVDVTSPQRRKAATDLMQHQRTAR